MAQTAELTVKSLRAAHIEMFELIKYILEGDETNGKAKSTLLKARIDALDTAIQASSDLQDLT